MNNIRFTQCNFKEFLLIMIAPNQVFFLVVFFLELRTNYLYPNNTHLIIAERPIDFVQLQIPFNINESWNPVQKVIMGFILEILLLGFEVSVIIKQKWIFVVSLGSWVQDLVSKLFTLEKFGMMVFHLLLIFYLLLHLRLHLSILVPHLIWFGQNSIALHLLFNLNRLSFSLIYGKARLTLHGSLNNCSLHFISWICLIYF